jgi:muramidase (phage lysozyme)
MTVAFKDKDPCTDLILDFIAGGVPGNRTGESIGNYNAVIGNARASDDLGKKNLTQIYALMQARRNAGMPSTAMGRYQIIRSTLEKLVADKNLPSDTLFTPALQDDLAWTLMVGRGYRRWWRGDMSDEEFASSLSCEWASLPDPDNDGKSHYDGDSAGNHASTTLDAVYAMLKAARMAQKHDEPPVVPVDPVIVPVKTNVDWVKDIEQILAVAGGYPGAIDGKFDKPARLALNALVRRARKELK